MASSKIELRVAALEAEVTRLREQLGKTVPARTDWLDAVYGAFANNPDFEQAMRLGQQYRESLRPKARRKATRGDLKRSAKARRR